MCYNNFILTLNYTKSKKGTVDTKWITVKK